RERLWTVDPIDGTQAFVLGSPVSTFCIALIVNGKPVLGVIYDPHQDRLFRALEGQGSFVNDQPITISDETEVAQNFVILSSRLVGSPMTNGLLYDAIDQSKGKVFNFRSIAYGMMFVACGRAVAATAGYCGPWDIAPVLILLTEAGATVTDFEGNECRYNENDKGFLATNGHVHDAMLEILHG
ncbi:MAG: inositol monophosphatase, partial [Patescibacteria group bacterium]